ncbi:hypothetical protein SUGI_0635860 [Cryptomeria japonica]|nr:hypothetical protein SUGI_0635860 [Cryptomeria japonica]
MGIQSLQEMEMDQNLIGFEEENESEDEDKDNEEVREEKQKLINIIMQMDNQEVSVRMENAESHSLNMEEINDRLGLKFDCPNKESPGYGKVGRGRGRKPLKELRAQDGDAVNQKKITDMLYGKRDTWREIEEFIAGNDEDTFFLGGDLNVIRAASEKRGGVQIESLAQREFNSWIFNCGLIEVNMKNGNYTWSNMRVGSNNIAKRLDRSLFKGDMASFNFTFNSTIIYAAGSDHYPITLHIKEEEKHKRCPFKFERMSLQA